MHVGVSTHVKVHKQDSNHCHRSEENLYRVSSSHRCRTVWIVEALTNAPHWEEPMKGLVESATPNCERVSTRTDLQSSGVREKGRGRGQGRASGLTHVVEPVGRGAN